MQHHLPRIHKHDMCFYMPAILGGFVTTILEIEDGIEISEDIQVDNSKG